MGRRFAALLGAVCLALAIASCGGSGSQNQAAAGGAGPNLGANIRLADCTDWKQETSGDRLATIHTLRGFFGQPIGAGKKGSPQRPGAVLPDEQAYKLFQNYCALPAARGFKLYLLYGRAAGFSGNPGP
jgi:hypothetical protein